MLVIDGGSFAFREDKTAGGVYRRVPLSVFGDYYLHQSAFVTKPPTPFLPSPYCQTRKRRPLPDSFRDKSRFAVHIPEIGHKLQMTDSGPQVGGGV